MNDGWGRKALVCTVMKMNARTLWARLPGGKVVKRKIRRDLYQH